MSAPLPAMPTPPPGRGKPAPAPRAGLVWKVVAISLGSSLILLGIVGLFVPFLQGILMIIAGLAVLSPHSAIARSLTRRIKAKLGIKRRFPGEPEDDAPEDPEGRMTGDDPRAGA